MRLPSSDNSRAVIVGTSSYRPNSGFEPLPTVAKNVDSIAEFVRAETGLKHVTVVKDPVDSAAIIDAVRPSIQEAEDLILFYYAGHGVALDTGDVGLTHLASRSDGPGWSTLHYTQLRQEIRATRAPIKIVILDSCHSGRAFGHGALALADQNEVLRDLVEIEGAYVLTATNSTQRFAAAAGVDGCTAFTGLLLQVLRNGIEMGDEYLTMDSIYPLLVSKLRAAGNPLPRSTGSNNVAGIALTRNPRWRAQELVAVDFDHLAATFALSSNIESAAPSSPMHILRTLGTYLPEAKFAIFASRPDVEVRSFVEEFDADLIFQPDRARAGKGLDVQMAVYLMAKLKELSSLVLVSGDGDLIPVLHEVNHAGISTTVICAPRSGAVRLIETADNFVPLAQLDEMLTVRPVKLKDSADSRDGRPRGRVSVETANVDAGAGSLISVGRRDAQGVKTLAPSPVEAVQTINPGFPITGICWDPDGRRIVLATKDAALTVADIIGKQPKNPLIIKDQRGLMDSPWIIDVSFSRQGDRLATASSYAPFDLNGPSRRRNVGAVKLWDTQTGKHLFEIGSRLMATAVTFSPDGTKVATAGHGTGASIWDAVKVRREPLLRLPHMCTVRAVAFSPDGMRLATGGEDNCARIWDARTGNELLPIPHDGAVVAVAFNDDGSRLATAGPDNIARIWDSANKKCLLPLAHEATVSAVAFSSDGTRLATGGGDNTAWIWDATDGNPLLRLPHDSAVTAVAFGPDGTQLATATERDGAWIWDMATPQDDSG